MTTIVVAPSRPRAGLALLCGCALLVLLLIGLRAGFDRYPLVTMIAESAFKYLSMVYVAGRIAEWFVLAVGKRLAGLIPFSSHQEVIND